MSPCGSYYKEGINPVKIMVEQQFVRAVVVVQVKRKQLVTMLSA